MEKIKQYSNKTINYILPMAFMSNSFISCILLTIAYPYFNDHEDYRIFITTGLCFIMWLILFFNIVVNIRKHSAKEIISILILILVTFLPFCFAIINYGYDIEYFMMMGRYSIFVIMYIFIAIILNRDKKYKEFISYFKWYGIALIPFVVFYVSRMFQIETEANEFINIAGMSYTVVASPLFIILLASIVELSVTKRRKTHFLNWLIVFAFGITIIYSGSRSMLIAMLWAMVIVVALFVRKNQREKNVRIFKITLMICIMFLFSSYIWAPVSSGFGDGGRSHGIIANELNRDEKLVDNNPLQDIFYEEIISSEEKAEKTIEKVKQQIIGGKLYKEQVESGQFTLEDVKEYKFVTPRMALYKYALAEFKKSPIVGNGMLYYQNKYGTYPHNWFLESLCDFGLIFTCIINLIICAIIFIVVKMTKNDLFARGIVLICLAYIPVHMLSGSMYINDKIMFSVVFSIGYILKNRKSGMHENY